MAYKTQGMEGIKIKKRSPTLYDGDFHVHVVEYMHEHLLSGSDYRLLCLLIKNSNKTLPRNTILDALWDGSGNFVNLLTIRGFGYQWREVPE